MKRLTASHYIAGITCASVGAYLAPTHRERVVDEHRAFLPADEAVTIVDQRREGKIVDVGPLEVGKGDRTLDNLPNRLRVLPRSEKRPQVLVRSPEVE